MKVITNPDFPRDGRITYDLVEELSIGIEEGDENYILNRPFDLKISDSGTIYILDWGDVRIQVYNKNGKYLRTIGRKGQGSGEFDTPAYFDLSADGKIYLMDSRQRRITIFDTTGKYVSSFRGTGGYHSEMKADKKSNMYFQKKIYDEENYEKVEGKISLHRYNEAGKELINYGEFTDEKRIVVKIGITSSVSLSGRNFQITVWAVNKNMKRN